MKSELMFKEIYEVVVSTEQKEVSEESKEKADVGEEEGDKNAANDNGRWWLHALLGVIGLIVLGMVFLIIRKHNWVKKRREKIQ